MTWTPQNNSNEVRPEDLKLPEYISNLKQLKFGGMGAVFEATDSRNGRKLAVKALLPRHVGNDTERKRFVREAEIISSLDNPHIVKLYDYGVSASNTPYMVMEFIEGHSLLTAFQTGGNLTIEQSLDLYAQVADGLKHAHSRGVLHRDLKPSNIMLTQVNEKVVVKLVDFGIAKFYRDEAVLHEDETPLTLAGEALGTPIYMSPEQCMAKPVDERSDIYSLGCVMYHTLTGKRPVEGKSAAEILAKHVNSETDTSIVPDVVRPFVRKCLEKDPFDRYQTMTEIIDVLNILQSKGATPFHLTGKQKKSVRGLVKSIIGVILGFCVGYGVYLLVTGLMSR